MTDPLNLNPPPDFHAKEVRFDPDDPVHPTHFLDHHWWEKGRCESFQKWPRGLRVHWSYWNEFKKEVDFAWYYKLTRCWWGKHSFQVWWSKGKIHAIVCRYCGKQQSIPADYKTKESE